MELRSDLPWDIICHEILTRTSMETIGRFRAVSKDSNHITYTPRFMQSFHRRTKRVSGYFIQRLNNYRHSSTTFLCIDQPDANCETSLKFLPRPVKIQASSNVLGLLLCVEQDPYRSNQVPPPYYVCKPSTMQWQVLPNPETRYSTVSIAMMVLRADPLCYKIVRLSEPKGRSNDGHYKIERLRVEVFYSKSWDWRQLDDITLPHGVFLSNAPATGASGALHWLTTDNRILAFDTKKETCNTFMLPEPFHGNRHNYWFVEVTKFKGRLAAMGIKRCEGESLEIWVMENYSRKTWTKVGDFKCPEEWGRPVGFYDDETAVFKGWLSGLVLHKFKNKANNESKLKTNRGRAGEVFFYESDFQPCDMMTKN